MALEPLAIIGRLLAAMVVGTILGYERTRRRKPAGIRTHALVCITSTAISIISAYGFAELTGNVVSDPARLIVGIITGIGFLGAGIIWKETGSDVRGLTTAANVWAAAALGIGVGLGHYFLVTATVVMMQVALRMAKILSFLGLIRYEENEKPIHPSED